MSRAAEFADSATERQVERRLPGGSNSWRFSIVGTKESPLLRPPDGAGTLLFAAGFPYLRGAPNPRAFGGLPIFGGLEMARISLIINSMQMLTQKTWARRGLGMVFWAGTLSMVCAQEWEWQASSFSNLGEVNAIAAFDSSGGVTNGFFAVTNEGYLLKSATGVNWTYSRPTGEIIHDIAIEGFGTIVMAINNFGTTSDVWESTNAGSSWTQTSGRDQNGNRFTPQSIHAVAAGNGILAMGTFTDSFGWKNLLMGPGDYYHPGSWTSSISGNPGNVADIVYQGRGANSAWWIVSFAGEVNGFGVRKSPLGPTFNFSSGVRFSGFGDNGRAIAISSDGNILVAVGGSRMLRSGNAGDSWTSRPALRDPDGNVVDLYTVRWVNGQFLASGIPAHVFSSPDGLTWTYRGLAGSPATINDIAYLGGRYVLVGRDRSSPSNAFVAISDGRLAAGQGNTAADRRKIGRIRDRMKKLRQRIRRLRQRDSSVVDYSDRVRGLKGKIGRLRVRLRSL